MIYDDYYNTIIGTPIDIYHAPTVLDPANYKIPYISITYNATGTSATILITPPASSPLSYGGAVAGTGSFNDPDFVINFNAQFGYELSHTVNGLIPGSLYSLRLRAYSGSNQTGTYGEYYYDRLMPPKPSNVSGITSTTSSTQTPYSSALDEWNEIMTRAKLNEILQNSLNNQTTVSDIDYGPVDASISNQTVDSGTAIAISGNREVQTSLFTITNNSIDKNKYSLAIKNSNISTGYSRYAFGTSLFFSSNFDKVNGSGGIGFFISNNGLTGYYISIQTTANLSDKADKEIKIIKVVNGKKIVLNDSQGNSPSKTLTGILGGLTYKVDINVTVSSSSRKIEAYINNFKITAIDETEAGSSDKTKQVLPITSNIAMFADTGRVSYDYFYATPLTEQQYESGIIQNIYQGKYGIKTLSFIYGDKILENKLIATDHLPFLEEFGTVAREIRRVKIKYQDRPGDPLYTSVGINKFVSILGQRLTSFGAEIYLINNSGTLVPLDDSNFYSFSVIGNYIVVTGQHEYSSLAPDENSIVEPVVFESSWIQSENDAKNLSTWIQNQWSKQQSIVEMEVFSNPIISVGDVISINYPKNNLDGTQKFVITRVDNSFKEGLQTTITARSVIS